jgi:type II secretory pathway component PulL
MTDPITQTQADRARYNTLAGKVRAPQPRKQSDWRWLVWLSMIFAAAVMVVSAKPTLIEGMF